jgi:hypothetical protein
MNTKIRVRDLWQEALSEGDRAPKLDPDKAKQFAAQLRALIPNLDELAEEEESPFVSLLGAERWRRWSRAVLGAVTVTIAEGERARITAGQALESLLQTPMEWRFAEAGGVRGDESFSDSGLLETDNLPGQPELTVTVDEEDAAQRVLIATLRTVSEDDMAPLMLAKRMDDPQSAPLTLEPVALLRSGIWQYRLPLEDGEYAVVFGPR